jgi:hypothetical protein
MNMLYVALLFSAVLGIIFRYNVGLVESCRVVGVNLANLDTKVGYQDAITPPASSLFALATWVVSIIFLVFLFYYFGWRYGFLSIAIYFLFSTIAGASIIPGPESKHFLGRIYRSLVNRYADYIKSNDTERAAAIKFLIDLFEEKYSAKLTR